MAAIFLFWDTNMAVVTSCENTIVTVILVVPIITTKSYITVRTLAVVNKNLH